MWKQKRKKTITGCNKLFGRWLKGGGIKHTQWGCWFPQGDLPVKTLHAGRDPAAGRIETHSS